MIFPKITQKTLRNFRKDSKSRFDISEKHILDWYGKVLVCNRVMSYYLFKRTEKETVEELGMAPTSVSIYIRILEEG